MTKEICPECKFRKVCGLETKKRYGESNCNMDEKTEGKLCPLTRQTCLGDKCACYLRIMKERILATKEYRFTDPEYYYRYEGCGLIPKIPWKLEKIPETPETPEMRQAQEAYRKLEVKAQP